METTAYYAFGLPIYVGLVVLEWWVARRRNASTLSFAPSFGNVSAGLGAIIVGLFLGVGLLGMYEWAHSHHAIVHWARGSFVPWVLAIVLADLAHYAHHRLDHRVAACWAVHGVHHMPEEMNFTVAMRHAWFSDVYSWPFYAPLPLLGVPTSHFFAATTLLSFHALITHTAHFDFPSLGIFVTPRSHILHHAKNPRYLDKNFGAMFCIWDRLFGTHVTRDPKDPPVYGTVRGYATHDGALAQWVLWRDLLRLFGAAKTTRDKLRVLFAHPGWEPAGMTLPPPIPPPRHTPRPHAAYVGLQLAILVVFSLYVFILRGEHSWWFKSLAAGAMIFGLLSLGAILDGRPHAWRWERTRMALSVGLLAQLAFFG